MAVQGAIDLGTNTCLLLVAETKANGAGVPQTLQKTLVDRMEYVRLGQGVHQSRRLAPEAMDRARKCLKEYSRLCKENGVEEIFAVATSASRDAANSKEFFSTIAEETGISFRVISGETEAKLTFLGGLLDYQNPYRAAVMDIGGGSTEFVTLREGDDEGVLGGQSIDMGCVRATEIFLKGDPYSRDSLAELEKSLKKTWATLDSSLQEELRSKDWTAVAGTPTTLAAMALGLPSFIPSRVDGFRLDRCTVADFFESLAIQPQSQRVANPLMGSGRSDIMVAGVAILLTAMEFFEKQDVVVSSRGLRQGALLRPDLISS